MTKSGIFHGWVVVAAAFVVLFIGFGIAYAFGAFFQPLQREFDATRGEIALIFSLSAFLLFGLGAVSGAIADRVGPRWIVSAGMALIGIGLLLASQARELWQVYASYGLGVGLGVGMAYVPAIGAVQRWFVRRRGFASGLAVAGIGLGTLVMPLAAGELIELFDWRATYVIFALLAIIVGCATALLLEDSPARRGLAPDGGPAPAALTGAEGGDVGTYGFSAHPDGGFSAWQALTSRPFWLLYLSAALSSFALFIPFVHLAAYALDQGHSEATAVFLLALIGAGSLAGRFAFGGTADSFGRRRSLTAMYAGMAVMLTWWLGSSAAWALGVFAFLFGAFYGGLVALVPALTADYFGGRAISTIIGLLYTSVAFGALLGPPLAGMAYDVSQSYTLTIAASALANALAVACMMLLADPAPPSTGRG